MTFQAALAGAKRRLIDDERGMTLMELMVGTLAATIVTMAGYQMWSMATTMQTRTTERIDAVGRGRTAMERITRDLRSQQCLDSATPAMQWAADLGMQFYASVAAERSGSQQVERRRIEWIPQPPTKEFGMVTTIGDIVETVWRSKETVPPYSFPTVTTKSIIAEDVESDPNIPMFRYYGYDPGQVGRPSSTPYPLVAQATNSINTLGRGVATANLARIVLVDIRYLARPRRARDTLPATVPFANRVSVRTADPSEPTRSPLCF